MAEEDHVCYVGEDDQRGQHVEDWEGPNMLGREEDYYRLGTAGE